MKKIISIFAFSMLITSMSAFSCTQEEAKEKIDKRLSLLFEGNEVYTSAPKAVFENGVLEGYVVKFFGLDSDSSGTIGELKIGILGSGENKICAGILTTAENNINKK